MQTAWTANRPLTCRSLANAVEEVYRFSAASIGASDATRDTRSTTKALEGHLMT